MTKRFSFGVFVLIVAYVFVAMTYGMLSDGAVTASGENAAPVEDVVLPAVEAEPEPEPVETSEPEPVESVPPTVPDEPEPVFSSEPVETMADCREILKSADDGTEIWTECYVWFVETSETPEEQAEAQEILTRDAEPEPERIEEDDPRWDCRTMGNFQCGVQIQGEWYVVTFEDGEPVGVAKQ